MNTDSAKPIAFWQKVLAPSCTAVIELVAFGHVCDRIKTFQQSNPSINSIFQASQLIQKQEGLRGFYTGLRWNMLTHSSKAMFRWHSVKYFQTCYDKRFPNSYFSSFLTGCSVGTAETFCLICPAESIKTKEMTKKSKDFKLRHFFKEFGFRGLYDGYDTTLLRQAISWSSFLCGWDLSNKAAHQITGKTNLNDIEEFIVGAAAGVLNVICTTPIDTIKTQVQKQNPVNGRYLFSAFKNFYQTHGLRKLYSGFKIRAIRSTWHAGITLFVMKKLGFLKSHKF